MRSSRKFTALAASMLLAWGGVSPAPAAKKEEKPRETDKKKEAGRKGEKEEKKSAGKGGVTDDGKGKMALPLIEGHDAKGLKIPYFGSTGQIQMIFTIGLASRLDADHVKMADLLVETFDDAGRKEMTIDLPASVLDLNTRVLTTETGVTIRREDFEITSRQMRFNTQTKQGELAGNVRMLIFDLDEKTASEIKPATIPTEPARE
jgi:hypothetical protein